MAETPVFGMSVCSGVDGIGLGLSIAIPGYRTIVAVEREGHPSAVLAARAQDGSIPEIAHWDDVATFDGRAWRGAIDILHAGIPCQPWSVAGKREGTEDERWIWPDVARIVREVEPELVFLENVRGFIRGGLGLVIRDLAQLGYRYAYDIFSAAECGAPHRRERVFLLAYDVCRRSHPRWSGPEEARERSEADGSERFSQSMADSTRRGFGELREPSTGRERQPDGSDQGLADAECARCDGSAREEQRICRQPLLSTRSEHGDRALADASGGQLSKPRRGSQGRDGTGSAGEILADAAIARFPLRRDQPRDGGEASGNATAERAGIPLFPPGPADRNAWREILRCFPELAPAIESGFRDLDDGLAAVVARHRTDALRAAGNGVVAIEAALAFVVLARRLLGA